VKRHLGRIALAALAVAAASAAWVARADEPPWNALSAQQRAALAPLQRDWATLDEASRQKWLDIAARYPSMPPDERARMQERMSAWSRMTPQQRGQARLQFQEARQLSPRERQQRWEAYQALPLERRQELTRRATSPPPRGSEPEIAPKSNVVPNPSEGVRAKTVAPTVVQVRPGATTRLVTEPAAQPRHQQTGVPKIAATPAFVDSNTLLPRRGPQAAATRPASAPEDGRRK
jgi:hypothetical protein